MLLRPRVESDGQIQAHLSRVPKKEGGGGGEEEDDACTGDPPALEETRRNRAFYEFKEEIRYKSTSVFTTNNPTDASDLHVEVDPEGGCVRPRFWDRFPLLWAGCRLTHGVQCGGAGTSFEVRLEGRSHASAGASSEQAAEEQRLESHSLRVGEDELSYAYDGQGRVVSGGKAEEFGEALSDGDIIGCYLGYSLSFRLDTAGGPWYPGPPGFTPLVALPVVDRVQAPAGPSSRTECEGGGQQERKLQQASQCLTELIKMAALKPGNYILDQPNVFVSARRHKLQLFGGYRRRVVAVVFPPAEEWRRRLALRQTQDGERIPDIALLKLQVSYTLPDQQGEPFEELRYMELPQQEAQALLHTYREEARRLLPPVPKPQKKASVRKNRAFGPPPFHSSQWKRRYAGNHNRFTRQAWAPQPIYWHSSRPDQGYYYNTGVGYIGYQAHW
ncbi:hypothetical protein CRUP_010257 [Coryphaenoides rupestris]|nr:hypothetical protein CRUP_010257 [Coryphaenoides rupestris]